MKKRLISMISLSICFLLIGCTLKQTQEKDTPDIKKETVIQDNSNNIKNEEKNMEKKNFNY